MSKKRFLAFHLLNDYSGSPLVLSNCINTLVSNGHEVILYTSKSSGFLSETKCQKRSLSYYYSNIKLLTLISFFSTQFTLFFRVIIELLKTDQIKKPALIINTMLPFGAALAGRCMGCEVIYYVHETSIRPKFFKRLLKYFINLTANKIIFVSKYLKDIESKNLSYRSNKTVIYNSLPAYYGEEIIKHHTKESFCVFMASSLKHYKGVHEFIELAKKNKLSQISFILALNAPQKDVASFQGKVDPSENVKILYNPNNINEIYAKSSVVLNLSRENEWIETFGMTVIEAFYFGCPVIVPEVGGITELVQDSVNGFKISSKKLEKIADTILDLASNQEKYQKMSINAKSSAKEYDFEVYRCRIVNFLI